LWPLRSRKVQVALATLVASFAAQAGWDVKEESLYWIIAVGVTLILGIAIEDHGLKQGAARALPPSDPNQRPLSTKPTDNGT